MDERAAVDALAAQTDSVKAELAEAKETVQQVVREDNEASSQRDNKATRQQDNEATSQQNNETTRQQVNETTSQRDKQKKKKHPLGHVSSYKACFPDLQEVQIVAAQKWGVKPVLNRAQAEDRKDELVYVSANPYFAVDRNLTSSIPYLVPRASELVARIGRNFMDSLYVKGVPMHKIIVSSVLRTEADVVRLRRINGNASEQSCHRYGTTVDICYNRFLTVSPPDGPERRAVNNDTLKWVLSQVLRDLRSEKRCYVKYEVKQGCFHLTVR